MTPHDPTPALAPARVERWITLDGSDIGTAMYYAREWAEKDANLRAVTHGRPFRVAHLVELRPGDLLIPSEAREGAVDRASEAAQRVIAEHCTSHDLDLSVVAYRAVEAALEALR